MPRSTRNSRKSTARLSQIFSDPDRVWSLIRQRRKPTQRIYKMLLKWKAPTYQTIFLELFKAKALLSATQARALVAHFQTLGGDWRLHHAIYPFVYARGKLTAAADAHGACYYGGSADYTDTYVWFEPGNTLGISVQQLWP